MESLASILELSLQRLGIAVPIRRYAVFRVWEEVVGPRIAAVSEPVRVDQDRLFVKVRDDAWRNELIYVREALIGRLNRRLGGDFIREIHFQ